MLPPEEERVEFIFAHLISGNGPYRTATLECYADFASCCGFFFVTMIIVTEKYIILYRISFFAIEPTVRT